MLQSDFSLFAKSFYLIDNSFSKTSCYNFAEFLFMYFYEDFITENTLIEYNANTFTGSIEQKILVKMLEVYKKIQS